MPCGPWCEECGCGRLWCAPPYMWCMLAAAAWPLLKPGSRCWCIDPRRAIWPLGLCTLLMMGPDMAGREYEGKGRVYCVN